MIGEFNLGTGGSKIDGLIKEYLVLSGGTVKAGEFVKFVNKYESAGNWHCNIGLLSYANPKNFSSIMVSENKVLILYSNTNSSYIYAVLCNIADNTITTSTEVAIYHNTNSAIRSTIASLTENKFFYACNGVGHMEVGMLEIGNDTITLKDSTTFPGVTSNAYTGLENIVVISENKVLVNYLYNNYVNSRICTIDNYNITQGSEKHISTSYGTSEKGFSTVLISENKFFVTFGANNKLYGVINTIENDTITIGTPTLIYEGANITKEVIKLPDDKLLIIYDTATNLYGIVCSLNEDTITPSVPVLLANDSNLIADKQNIVQKDDMIIIFHKIVSTNSLAKTSLTIQDLNILVDNTAIINNADKSGYNFSAYLLNDKLLTINNYATDNDLTVDLYGNFNNGIDKVTKSNDKILGVSKTSGVSGEKIKVYVPNVIEGE